MQPVSACAAERNWSVIVGIYTDKTAAHNSMQHHVADLRVYCHETMHYKRLLRNASHKKQVASWVDMSDSDSDSEDPDKDMHIAHLLR